MLGSSPSSDNSSGEFCRTIILIILHHYNQIIMIIMYGRSRQGRVLPHNYIIMPHNYIIILYDYNHIVLDIPQKTCLYWNQES